MRSIVIPAMECSRLALAYVLSPLALFFFGSIPFGYIAGRINGVDLRQHGSGNIGATNAWRVLGKGWGSFAFAGDFFKGFLPLLALQYYTHWSHENSYQGLYIVSGMAAVLGHNFTPWLRFNGGKGIATSAGVLAALLPITFGIALTTWIVVTYLSRMVSVGSIAACCVLPVATVLFYPGQWLFFVFSLLTGILGIWRHRSNITRIRAGTESRIGQPKPKA